MTDAEPQPSSERMRSTDGQSDSGQVVPASADTSPGPRPYRSAKVIRLWHRMLLMALVLAAVRSGWGDERIVFSGFGFAEHVITPAPFLLGFSNRPADRRAQLIGVGWYEYALVTGEKVEFVAEERGVIFERRASSYAASRLCDLYEAAYAGTGHPIAMPGDLARYQDEAMTTDTRLAIDLRKQDFKPLLLRIACAAFFELDITEPGFIQTERS